MKEFKEMGILGVEISYDYSNMKIKEEPSVVLEAANELGLIGTGGTDYHGEDWRGPIGTVSVPIQTIDHLRKAAQELGNDIHSWER
ncbi:MAG: hypothetical protein ACFFED_16305 [Candidatus Thorarchaeota archaeon]